MMAIDYAALKAEIQTDPQAIGYAGKQDNQVADLLNAPRTPTKGRITREEFILWAAATGAAGKIEIASRGTDAAASLAISIKWLLELDSFDVGNNRVQALLANMVSTLGITAPQRNALETAATRPISRAEVLFGQAVSDRDIAIAFGRVS